MKGQRRIVTEAEQLMTNDLKERYTVEELSSRFGISASAFKMYFSAVNGKPVSQCMREKRMEKAKELLETTDESIGEIALASAKAIRLAHEKYPQFKMGNMNLFATKYPYTCNPADVLECQKQMRIVNGFCSDVQVRGYYPTYIERYFDEKGIKIAKEPGDDEILRNGTIDFYTFSYYMSPLRPARWPRDTVLSM